MIREIINFTRDLMFDFPDVLQWNATPNDGLHIFVDVDEEGNWQKDTTEVYHIKKGVGNIDKETFFKNLEEKEFIYLCKNNTFTSQKQSNEGELTEHDEVTDSEDDLDDALEEDSEYKEEEYEEEDSEQEPEYEEETDFVEPDVDEQEDSTDETTHNDMVSFILGLLEKLISAIIAFIFASFEK